MVRFASVLVLLLCAGLVGAQDYSMIQPYQGGYYGGGFAPQRYNAPQFVFAPRVRVYESFGTCNGGNSAYSYGAPSYGGYGYGPPVYNYAPQGYGYSQPSFGGGYGFGGGGFYSAPPPVQFAGGCPGGICPR